MARRSRASLMLVMPKSKSLIGIDEAGRGPIAGPVAVGVIRVAEQNLRKFHHYFSGAKDCKQLSPAQREAWFAKIKTATQNGLVEYSVSLCGNRMIDKRGIIPAIKKALRTSLARLKANPSYCRILLDGSLVAPKIYLNQQTIIRGDESQLIIAVASIVAKVRRDRHMTRLALKYPDYQFEVHKGYGTRAHYRALKLSGPSPVHRLSFLP